MHTELSSSSPSPSSTEENAERYFTYNLKKIEYPNMNTSDIQIWRSLFKQCASQRLFLPAILIDYDSIIYLDTDVLVFTPITQIWSFFNQMNQTQLAAATYESEDYSSNWYYRFARHPYYPPYGLNSGVMLMNLTRMRKFGWTERLPSILNEYRSKIVWGDQDIINIIFSKNIDRIFVMDCSWNYRPDHCVYSQTCRSAKQNGIQILHGNRGSFVQPDKQPIFKMIFQLIEQFNLGRNESSTIIIIDELKQIMFKQNNIVGQSNLKNNCDKIPNLIIKSIESNIKNDNDN